MKRPQKLSQRTLERRKRAKKWKNAHGSVTVFGGNTNGMVKSGKPDLKVQDYVKSTCNSRRKQALRSQEHRNSHLFHPAVLAAGRHWSKGLQEAPRARLLWENVQNRPKYRRFRSIATLNFMHRHDKSLIGAKCVALPHGKLAAAPVFGVIDGFRRRNGLRPNVWVYIRTSVGPNTKPGPAKKPKKASTKAQKRGIYVQDGTLVFAKPKFYSNLVRSAQRMELLEKRGLDKITIQTRVSPYVFTDPQVAKLDKYLKRPELRGTELVKKVQKAMKRLTLPL